MRLDEETRSGPPQKRATIPRDEAAKKQQRTLDCIDCLSVYLLDPLTKKKFPHCPPKALVTAIKLVVNNNRIKSGDIFVHQLKGIAMGMSPAPPITNL